VAWEYLLNTLLNPAIDWNAPGVAAHMGLDLVMLAPMIALALGLGLGLSRRLGLGGGLSRTNAADVLGTVGAIGLVFALVVLPVTSTRDLAHEWVGTTYGLSLAEVQTTVVRTDLTVQESTQLCSFGSVRNPSLARDGYQSLESTVLLRARSGARDVLVQLAAFLPLLLAALLVGTRERWAGGRSRTRGLPAPLVELVRWSTRPLRLGSVAALGVLALVCFGGTDDSVAGIDTSMAVAPYNACAEGGPLRTYDVSAIGVTITLNRWGDHVDEAYMYALDANIPTVRQFEADVEADRAEPPVLGEPGAVTRVSHGLRKDPIQPLVLRANLGECLQVHFTNRLDDGPASMHILGLPHSVQSAGGAVGDNPDTFAAPSQTVTYEIPIPRDPNAERAYYFHDHGASRERQSLGLFGAIVVEPEGATYLDPETGDPLDTVTGSNWEAIIMDPNVDGSPDGKSFREFVIFYHEIGNEAFTDIFDRDGKKVPLVDEVAGVYRPAARALNYRSEPFRRRLEIRKTAKSLGYASYPFGDPATPMPRSYRGEAVKTRLLHGGSEVFHVHHLHGGADRWRRNPNSDPNNDFWKGLTKIPDPDLESIHLDSQSIGPGTSYNLEHECGSGGCQQAVGDFLYHCHIGHHYISGMWSFWRVFGTIQTAETNVNGHPLAVIPEVYQNPGNPLMPPGEPELGVSAGDLIGLTVDDDRTIVADTAVVDPSTQIGVLDWIRRQLPPAGVPFDILDATVWNWTHTGAGETLQIWGEPESDQPFDGYVSETPGQRPEVLFNPRNGRYTWPLFRPQRGARPPFTARHTGAPWLGEEMKEGRVDGLCARNGVHPSVDVGNAVLRRYPVSAITLPIGVTPDRQDRNGMLFVLNEDEQQIRQGVKPAEPLAIRSNVGDCVEITFTNKIPDGPLNGDFSKVNIHSHFVQFDPQASDGVITGFSYEQSVRPIESEGRTLTTTAPAGATTLEVDHTERLRPGIWLGVGLGEATCGFDADGQPLRCQEIRKIAAIPDPQTIVLDRPLDRPHQKGQAVGVEFVRYHWYSDVDTGTVFFHDHVEFKNWDHGLFGAHIIEPKGSTYHDPRTGDEVRAGTLVDVRVDPDAGGNPVAHGVDGSFREFMLFLHNNNPVEGRFARGGGTINLRAEPLRLRRGDSAYRFSSVAHGDPHTQTVRAYLGDPVVVRGMGLVERVGGVRFTGHRFHQERVNENSDIRDTTYIGISERFDLSLEGGAGGPGGYPGDYLYYSTLGKDLESGAWGILRVHDAVEPDLQPLPDRPQPAGGNGFPQLSHTGGEPPSLGDGPGDACPAGAPVREYDVAISDTTIVYNDLKNGDRAATAYHLDGVPSPEARTPLVLRANAGDCLRVHLRNRRQTSRASLSVGELISDPQRSYGGAIGFNHDSTVPAGAVRTYEYYADTELGVVVGLNLADLGSVERGAFAGVVIEPEGAQYTRPGQTTALPGGGAGVQADIWTDSGVTREFVALISDQDRRIGASAMPYPEDVSGFNGISYAAEPLALRSMDHDPSGVFKSSLWGDPRWMVTVPRGTPLTFRVAQPWGHQAHLPTLEGHRYPLEPGMAGSEQVFNQVLVPGMSLNFDFIGGAGGDIQAPGDFLFLDRRQPFLEGGLWMMLRSTADGSAITADRISILGATLDDGGRTVLRGRVGPRPAGDFVPSVSIHEGPAVGGVCSGRVIGRSPVEPGSGAWQLRSTALPDEICVASPAGGVSSAPLADVGVGGPSVPLRVDR
jgi:hypothetical protein